MAFRAGQKLRASNLGQNTHYASYTNSTNQTISTGTDTVLSFDTVEHSSSYVTRAASGSGHTFELEAGGMWAIVGNVRWSTTGASATGEKALHIEDSLGIWKGSNSGTPDTDVPLTLVVPIFQYFIAGTVLHAEVWQNSGGNQDVESNSSFGVPRITFALILRDG